MVFISHYRLSVIGYEYGLALVPRGCCGEVYLLIF